MVAALRPVEVSRTGVVDSRRKFCNTLKHDLVQLVVHSVILSNLETSDMFKRTMHICDIVREPNEPE